MFKNLIRSILFLHLLSIVSSRTCLKLKPYCDCELNSALRKKDADLHNSLNLNDQSNQSYHPKNLNQKNLKNAKNSNKNITVDLDSNDLNYKIMNLTMNNIFLNCTNITDPTIFLNKLKSSLKDSTFNLQLNNIKHQTVDLILRNLIKLNLESNLNGLTIVNLDEIRNLTSNLDLIKFTNLTYIQINSNKFNYLDCSKFSKNLNIIDLSGNQLKEIYGCDLIGDFKYLTNLDLSRNNLTTVDLTKLNKLIIRDLEQINLTSNDWNCTYEFVNLIELNKQIFTYKDDQLKCNQPRNLTGLTLRHAADIYNSEICSKCECYLQRGNIVGLDCERRGLNELPRKIPFNTKIVNLDHNFLSSLDFKDVNKEEREIWKNVIKLSVRHNNISTLDGLDFDLIQNVLLLNLTHNSLTSISNENLKKMSHLQILNLGFNPWKCDCSTSSFQNWLRNQGGVDLENIKCDNLVNSQAIYKLNPSELCRKTNQTLYWDVANLCLSISITFLIVKLLYDYLWKLKTGKLPYFFKLNF